MLYRRMGIVITVIGTLEKPQRRKRSEGSGVAGIKIVKRTRKGRGRGNRNTTVRVKRIEQETSGETMTDRAI